MPVEREHLERRGIRAGDGVGLADTGESLDCGTIESDAVRERGLELGGRDRDGLQVAEDVGEPEPDEADLPLFHGTQDEFLLAVHDIQL